MKLNTIISSTCISIIFVGLSFLVLLSLVGCADKAAVVYKTKEVNIAVRCDIDMPPLPQIEGLQLDAAAIEIVKSLEIHRKALKCCVEGKCNYEDK